jgi:hypothetical protein
MSGTAIAVLAGLFFAVMLAYLNYRFHLFTRQRR